MILCVYVPKMFEVMAFCVYFFVVFYFTAFHIIGGGN